MPAYFSLFLPFLKTIYSKNEQKIAFGWLRTRDLWQWEQPRCHHSCTTAAQI